jgi:hypothetical protein
MALFGDRPHRREVCPNLVEEVLELIRVLSGEDDVMGKKAVPDCVQTDCGFPLHRLWSGGVESVRPVSGFLSFARHASCLSLLSITPKQLRIKQLNTDNSFASVWKTSYSIEPI